MNKKNQGFTLVELMVVVAIIGILSSISIPLYNRYQAKSKTSEAKIILASIYTAQAGAMASYDQYARCHANMGFRPPPERWYSGQAAAGNSHPSVNLPPSCHSQDPFTGVASDEFPATKAIGGHLPQPQLDWGIFGHTDLDSFKYLVCGAISINQIEGCRLEVHDLWSIDDAKNLVHERPGY